MEFVVHGVKAAAAELGSTYGIAKRALHCTPDTSVADLQQLLVELCMQADSGDWLSMSTPQTYIFIVENLHLANHHVQSALEEVRVRRARRGAPCAAAYSLTRGLPLCRNPGPCPPHRHTAIAAGTTRARWP